MLALLVSVAAIAVFTVPKGGGEGGEAQERPEKQKAMPDAVLCPGLVGAKGIAST